MSNFCGDDTDDMISTRQRSVDSFCRSDEPPSSLGMKSAILEHIFFSGDSDLGDFAVDACELLRHKAGFDESTRGYHPFVNEAWLACGSLIIVVICMNPQFDWRLFFFYTKFDDMCSF